MKVSFPVASIFGALLTFIQIVNLIWSYAVRGYPVIPVALAGSLLQILCMGVLTAGLFLRQRNAMITGPLLLQSLGGLLYLVMVILDTVFHIKLIFPGFFRATLDWTIGLTGYALTGFLSWFFLLITAVNCFNDPDSRELKGSRLFWAAPGWLGFIHTLGRLIGASVLGGFPGGLISLFLEVPFLFLLGWWLTHPYAAPPQAALKYTAMQAASQQRQGYALPAAPQAPGYERPAAPQPVHAAFCPFCGQKLEPQHAFCPACGRPASLVSPAAGGARYAAPSAEADIPTGGLKVLCFLAPGVGLILYLVWKDTLPAKAGACGKAAIWGGIFWIVATILLTVLSVLIPLIIIGVSVRF